MKTKQWVVWLVAAVALVALLLFAHSRIHFNWRVFAEQLRGADWRRIALGIAFICIAYILRAARWALFVRPTKKVSTFSVLGSQVIGFTAVAIFGRLADLVRPYLVARKLNLPLSSQIAVYTVERMFDFGSMALIFSMVLLFAHDSVALPHHELLIRVARAGLLGTLALAAFAIAVRVWGAGVAALVQKLLHPMSASLADSVASKMRAFRNGLNAIGSFPDFGIAVALSLAMWGLITGAYLQTTHAFVHSPELADMTLSRCMLLMAASMGGSIVQLPIIGWFTTIGLTTTAMQKLFNVAWEPALGCATMLLVVTFMSIIPVGLLWARFEHVSLKKLAEDSGHAQEEVGASATVAE